LKILFAATALALLLACSASAKSTDGANLRITSPKLSTKGGIVSGAFTTRNTGDRRARKSKAVLKAGSLNIASVWVPALNRGRTKRVKLNRSVRLAPGTYKLKLCADSTKRVKERKEGDNCKNAGSAVVSATGPSSIPANPIAFTPNTRFYVSGGGGYWSIVPSAYDATHQTPTKLFVWLHGCGGENKWDIYNAAPAPTGNYIAIAPDGREGGCWDTGPDPARVISAIDDVRTHFNIDPRRVVLGGYSSGGDLAYRTAYYNSPRIAGVLSENTAPFAHIGVTTEQAIAAATFRFHVVHLAHTEDDTYTTPIVQTDIDSLVNAGFPTELISRPGNHWDNDVGSTGTVYDMKKYLLPYLVQDWTSPGS
jgi:predicted esterase